MERIAIKELKELFGKNYLGPEELLPLFSRMGISPERMIVPEPEFPIEELKKYTSDYLLILGLARLGDVELSIRSFRDCFGIDPEISEPCFYNQDWYLKERFIERTLENKWYLVKKSVIEESRRKQPEKILESGIVFPSAVLCTYAFFANYFYNHELLWYHDFVWCEDSDHNGDRIYVGKYHDVEGVNKNGFSIHRHLALRDCYAAITCRGEK